MNSRSSASLAALCVAAFFGCGKPAPRQLRKDEAQVPTGRFYRLDDHLSSAVVSAPQVNSSARVAEPVVWHDFLSERDVTWTLLRGMIGYRKGDLMVKGDGSTPVIQSPKGYAIDWGLYEAVRIRMLAEGGNEIKIKIGDLELRQKLGPPREYQVYRFDVNLDVPPGSRPLAIMPTDSLHDVVAISSIELVPRKARFEGAAGRERIGKQDEYRDAVYVHSPATLAWEIEIPPGSALHVGMGIAEAGKPVAFHVLAGGSELFSRTLSDVNKWEDARVDLASSAGSGVKITLRTEATKPDAVGFWANPVIVTRGPRPRPNVLVYLIDTLRADHTSLYGYSRNTTPFLKKLGDRGIVFEDCQTQATFTKPSVASMMTSLYSFTHAIVRDDDTIPKNAPTFAEQMRAAGYVTASMTASPFTGRNTGLDRGFDYLAEYEVIQRYRSDAVDRGTDSAALNKVVSAWLDHHRDEPFFLYAHATDPHAPYRPPAGYEEKFADPRNTAEFNREYSTLRDKRQYGGGAVVSRENVAEKGISPDQFIRSAADRYDGEILFNDHNLELLVERLRELGILDNTLIVVVSDHGEEFWDHGWTAHGHSLYQELTHGVFLMSDPGMFPAPRRIAEPVQLIDLMPTVLDLLGVPIPATVQGQSLAPLLRGQPFRRRGQVMSSRLAYPFARGLVPENGTDTVSVVDADWKLIYRDKAKEAGMRKVELYDRRTDRNEQHDVSAQHPREVERMTAEVVRWMDAEAQVKSLVRRGPKAPMDERTIERLRSLGYLGGK